MTVAPPELHHARWQRLRGLLSEQALDALLVSSPANVAYLTGFFGSAGFVVVQPDRLTLLSDGRYLEVIAERKRELAGLSASIAAPGGGSVEELMATELAALAPARLAFEARNFTIQQHHDLDRRLRTLGPACELVASDGLVDGLRLVKDWWEIATLRDAGHRLSDVAKCIIPKALAGIAERHLAAEIEWELRRVGFDKPAFDTIVASGPNAAMPHYRAGDRTLASGDLVVLDFGGVQHGYAVDMTRTVGVGSLGPWERTLIDRVAEAQQAAFRAVAPGTPAEQVDLVARTALDRAGLGEAFTHGVGHGLGLEVHERPRLTRRRDGVSQDVLAPGMVFTLEPGVYFPGRGGVRTEDDVLATADGAEWLTRVAET